MPTHDYVQDGHVHDCTTHYTSLEAATQAARIPTGSMIIYDTGRLRAASRGGQGTAGSATWCTPRSLGALWRRSSPGTGSPKSSTSRPGAARKIDAACRDRKVADLITAAGASAPADAVFGGRFATGEAPRSTTSASEADEGDGAGGDGGTSFDLFGPDPTPMEDL